MVEERVRECTERPHSGGAASGRWHSRPSPSISRTRAAPCCRSRSYSGATAAASTPGLAAIRPSLFSREGAGPMVWWSTPAACCGNSARARARATVQSVAS